MRIDFLATQSHYAQHLQPIYRALQDSAEVAHHDGTVPLADDGTPTVIAGFGDLAIVPASRPVALVDHGAGQAYRDVPHGSYNGGRGRERVGLFLYASGLGAAVNSEVYPDARHEVIGPVTLDAALGWSEMIVRAKGRRNLGDIADATLRRQRDGRKVVAFAWHWDLGICPETRSAFGHYLPVLERLAQGSPWRLLGHGHPRDAERHAMEYQRIGIEYVRDSAELLARADLVCFDNTSLGYEAAGLGIPTLAVDAPHFRAEVDHGLRFWTEIPGLRLMANRDQRPECGMVHGQWGRDVLAGAIEEALDDRASLKDWRTRVVDRVYGDTLDGKAAVRAAEAVLEWAT